MKRNGMRHGRAAGKCTVIDKQTNNLKIMEQFTWGTKGVALKNHKLIENGGLKDVLQFSPLNKTIWLKCVCAARTAEQKQQQMELGHMRTNMTGWLNLAVGNENSQEFPCSPDHWGTDVLSLHCPTHPLTW